MASISSFYLDYFLCYTKINVIQEKVSDSKHFSDDFSYFLLFNLKLHLYVSPIFFDKIVNKTETLTSGSKHFSDDHSAKN